MTTEQQTEDIAKRTKTELPVLITPDLVKLKINVELTRQKLSLEDLQNRALEIPRDEDHLKGMADLLKDLKSVDDLADEVFKKVKAPYWEAGKACDAGKKLVLDVTSLIRGSFQPQYNKLLTDVAERTRLANLKIATDAAILKGIEDNVITFSNKVVAAVTKKALSDVESLINLEKSPSRAKKYGEFHAQAVARYDVVLIPIIKDQKTKVDELEKLNAALLEAEESNDPDKMDELIGKVDLVSNEILQNHAVLQDAALNQDSFPIVVATEILPEFKIKRTNYSYEIVDVEVALKKARHLLEFAINKDEAKKVLEGLKGTNAFEGKDEVVVDGIKYIATRVREAL